MNDKEKMNENDRHTKTLL